MNPIKTILRRSISLLLAAAVLLPGAMPASAFAADTQSVAVQSVLAGKSAPYDLLIYFKSDASAALSLQQKADAAVIQQTLGVLDGGLCAVRVQLLAHGCSSSFWLTQLSRRWTRPFQRLSVFSLAVSLGIISSTSRV